MKIVLVVEENFFLENEECSLDFIEKDKDPVGIFFIEESYKFAHILCKRLENPIFFISLNKVFEKIKENTYFSLANRIFLVNRNLKKINFSLLDFSEDDVRYLADSNLIKAPVNDEKIIGTTVEFNDYTNIDEDKENFKNKKFPILFDFLKKRLTILNILQSSWNSDLFLNLLNRYICLIVIIIFSIFLGAKSYSFTSKTIDISRKINLIKTFCL